MEAPDEILLNSLANSGVAIPDAVSSIRSLTPPTLYSLCSDALRLIGGPNQASSSFPPSLPEDSMPERVKICTELSSAFKTIGFNHDLSFHKFLYPSEEDLYKLVRFLVGKLSESSATQTAALGDGDNIRCAAKEKPSDEGETLQNEETLTGLKDLGLKAHHPLETCYTESRDELARQATESNPLLQNVEIRDGESKPMIQDFRSECSKEDHPSYSIQEDESLRENAFRDQDDSQNQEKVLKKLTAIKHSDLKHPDEELRLLKVAAEMVFHGQHPVEFYIERLNEQVEVKRNKLKEMESEWDANAKPLLALQEKKRNLEESLFASYPEAREKLTRRKEIEIETESTLAEIKRREDELSRLSSDLEKQPKMATRRSYIERIIEITKNSRKQDNDIQQILKDTRELQLESNTIQERLARTYAIVDDTIFREAKKDPVARQAYRLLTNIHESFEQIAGKILATDRSWRDAADYEAKLAIIGARSSNTAKLQADLDAIRKENDLLEQHLLH